MRVEVYRDVSESANTSSSQAPAACADQEAGLALFCFGSRPARPTAAIAPNQNRRTRPALIEEIGTKIRELVLAFENENYPSDDPSDANDVGCDRLCDSANWLTWQAQAVRRRGHSWKEPPGW